MDHVRDAPRVTRARQTPRVTATSKPKIDHIIIEDDTPVDSIFAEKQQRLLTEPLHSSWRGGKKSRRFMAMANVGLFFNPDQPPLVPDMMLSFDVTQPKNLSKKENNTYFAWTRGKVPDAVIEIVSDRRGGEETKKMRQYCTWGIPYYVVFDPRNVLRHGVLRAFARNGVQYESRDPAWLEGLDLGLTLWAGVYENAQANWLRWCDHKGRVIPTGKERARKERARTKNERARAEAARQRSQKLEDQLRKLGVEPEL